MTVSNHELIAAFLIRVHLSDTGSFLTSLLYLFDHVSAADDNADSQPDGRAGKRELVGDLEGQLPRRCQDQGVDAVGVLAQRLRMALFIRTTFIKFIYSQGCQVVKKVV